MNPSLHKAICAHCGRTTREGIEPVSHDICRPCLFTHFPDDAEAVLARLELAAR